MRAIGQGASERSISCAIDGADTTVAVRTAHATFNFAHEPVSLRVCGKGTATGPAATLERVHRLPVPILVDCTAAAGMEALYQAAFRAGVHIVAANKAPLAQPWPAHQALLRATTTAPSSTRPRSESACR